MAKTKKSKKNARLKKERQQKFIRMANQKYADKYPSVVFKNEFDEFVDKNFVKEIQSIVRATKLNNRKLFKKWHQNFYILAKKHVIDSEDTFYEILRKAAKNILPFNAAHYEIVNIYGEII